MATNSSPIHTGRGSTALLMTLLAVSVAITTASAVTTAVIMNLDGEPNRWLGTFFQLIHIGRELSVSTWFASALWLLLAVIAFTAGVLADSKRGYWFAFGAIAAIASMDETATLHEKFYLAGSALTAYLPFDFFSYRWVIVGVIIAIVVAVSLLPFVLSLPRPVTIGIIVGGAIFLAGAIGLETLGGHAAAQYGDTSWQLHALMHVEEFFEYIGVAIAVYALSGMVRLVHRNESRAIVFTGYRTDLEQENASPSNDGDASLVIEANESPRI